jgi:hypothetical protein
MRDYSLGTDGYDSEHYGTGTGPDHDAIVAERTGGAQFVVVHVNPDGRAAPVTVTAR